MDIRAVDQQYNPYRLFTREQWASLRDDTPMTLEPGEFERLRSLHDRLHRLLAELFGAMLGSLVQQLAGVGRLSSRRRAGIDGGGKIVDGETRHQLNSYGFP